MTKEEYIKEHRKMWNWIAEQIKQIEEVVNINIAKDWYLKLNGYNEYVMNNCFACHYAISNSRCNREMCDHCLFIWTDIVCYGSERSEYKKVKNTTDYKEQYKYALIIANLNER